MSDDSIEIRLANDGDVEQIAGLYRAVYGDDYPFTEFYDTEWIKRGVYDRNIRWYVADESGDLLGSAAVMLNAGDADDLVGELGRLVVDPRARGRGLGTRLIREVTDEAERLCDFVFAETRTAHLGSQIIFEREGYHAVGIEPLVYELEEYESMVFACRLTDNARALRRSNPRVVPEAYELAQQALRVSKLPEDASALSHPEPYPRPRGGDDDLRIEEVSTRQAYRLVRLGRDCFLNPEVFGAFRLEHGHLKLKEHDARYLVLYRGKTALGGLGYTWDEVERKASIFELVAASDLARGALLEMGLSRIERHHDPRYITVDVNAHAPRMQRSLALLGFAPVVYAPSMVYVMGERFDVVRMVKLRQQPDLSHWALMEHVSEIGARIEENVARTVRGIDIDEIVRQVALFEGLTDVQIGALGRLCENRRYSEGEVLFEQGAKDQVLFIVRSGGVDITLEEEPDPVTTVGAGAFFGEMALVEELPRSAGAVCARETELLALTPQAFDTFVRQHPAGGAVVLGNIARALSRRLRRMNDLS